MLNVFHPIVVEGVDDNKKRQQVDQIVSLDQACPGGLLAYIKRARKLLGDAKAGKLLTMIWRASNRILELGIQIRWGSCSCENIEVLGKYPAGVPFGLCKQAQVTLP